MKALIGNSHISLFNENPYVGVHMQEFSSIFFSLLYFLLIIKYL